VLFGVVNTVACLDHLDPPQPPKCITALYVFAETHFDRGINDWLCKVRALFGAMNFWAIIMYNLVSLNSLKFTELVARRLLLTGFPQTTLSVLFVTYCGVQLVKERERTLALEEEQKQDKEKPE
ncbi:HHATL isoform 9, partial [Pan troglodytes]